MSNFPSAAIEVLRPDFVAGRFRAVLFDFDGTLSLIRRNWQNVMIPMMVRILGETAIVKTDADVTSGLVATPSTSHLILLHVFIKTPEGWQMIARQATKKEK